MHCARLRLNAKTTTIFVQDGWLIVEAAENDLLREQLSAVDGSRLLTVGEVSQRTGFTAGAVRSWIKRNLLSAVRVGKEYRIREESLRQLVEGKAAEDGSASRQIGRRRKAVTV
jgi:excisionase family DNA binding protein